MNNQVTILDKNNQSLTVDLICYFNSENKKYVFYSKNETVQDGLIKMYVSEENNGLFNDITQGDWDNLKKIMQGIITGSASNIEFLAYNNPVKFNEPKAIALNDANINTIKTAYKNAIGNSSNEPILNKDILTQNFGGMTESVTTQEPVQISPIPEIQNNFNMESVPVNLNPNPVIEESSSPVTETNNSFEPIIPNIEPIPSVSEIPSIESNTNPISNETEGALNINSIKPGGIESGFKVSNEPNIFDNPMPINITEEEINNPSMSEVNNAFNIPSIEDNKPEIKVDNDLNKKIELNERKIKLFEELASVYKEENELLKKQSETDSNLEKTASNLFDSNGILNDNEVLN